VQAGQLLGAEIALKEGIAANIAQGFHHASYESGAAYCTFNGLALVAKQNPEKRILFWIVINMEAMAQQYLPIG
jgi:acetoin utilization deacetylase AcuC-like enzyme